MKMTTKAILGVALATAGAGAMIALAGPGDHKSHAVADHDVAKVGHAAPHFKLMDLEKNEHALKTYLEDEDVNAVVLEWFNPGCPFVKKHYAFDDKTMLYLEEEFEGKGVVWLRINSGAEGKQGAGMENNTKAADEWNIESPILLDMSGEVGHAYGAKTTPHMYVIDSEGVLRYAGAIDDNKSARGKAEVNYVKDALSAVLAGETVEVKETKPYGCGVKYAN